MLAEYRAATVRERSPLPGAARSKAFMFNVSTTDGLPHWRLRLID